MNTQDVIGQFDRFVIGNYKRLPVVVERAAGSEMWDLDGKRYLDFFPGWGVGLLGHCHPRVVEAIQQQAGRLLHIDNTMYTLPQGELAQLIAERSFGGQCFFCNSGAEANEAAIKLARLAAGEGRYKILSMQRSFHGRTFAAMSATGQAKIQEGFTPIVAGFAHVPFNDLEAVAHAIDDETAAVLVEPIQGEGGVHVPADDYLPRLRSLCDERGVLLICDEVQTGCGRTGKWFGYQQWGVEPDIMTLAKGLGSGVSIGAMVARPEIAEKLVPGKHATTYGGSPLVCAAGVAVFRAIEAEGLLAHAEAMGQRIMDGVRAMSSPLVREVRGRGVMIGVELTQPGDQIVADALAAGLRINCTQQTVVRMLPAMNISPEQVDEGLGILAEVMRNNEQVGAGAAE